MSIAVDLDVKGRLLEMTLNNRMTNGFTLLHVVASGVKNDDYTCVYSAPPEAIAAYRSTPIAEARLLHNDMERGGRGKTRNKRGKKRTTRRKR